MPTSLFFLEKKPLILFPSFASTTLEYPEEDFVPIHEPADLNPYPVAEAAADVFSLVANPNLLKRPGPSSPLFSS